MKTVIVIPTHYNHLSETEKCSLEQCYKILHKYDIKFIIPESLPKENDLSCEWADYVRVPDTWMGSWNAYNKMLCINEFYEKFRTYDYMLIYQLDAFVFSDQLEYFCDLGYDYYGAPWLDGSIYSPMKNLPVGNGGFSLRKISSCMNVLKRRTYSDGAEDTFWAESRSEYFHIAPIDVALKFSFEYNLNRCYKLNNYQLPFGCHAWEKYDYTFWKPFIEAEGYSLNYSNERREPTYKHWINWTINAEALKCCLNYPEIEAKNVYIWGGGSSGFECGYFLKQIGVENFKYIDNDRTKKGCTLWEKEILQPDILCKEEHFAIFIASLKYEKEIQEQIEKTFHNCDILSWELIKNKIEAYITDNIMR